MLYIALPTYVYIDTYICIHAYTHIHLQVQSNNAVKFPFPVLVCKIMNVDKYVTWQHKEIQSSNNKEDLQ